MSPIISHLDFSHIEPATDLESMWTNFDPLLLVDPGSPQYIPRKDDALRKLAFEIRHARNPVHAFLCGHRGSGKTTELSRLCMDESIQKKFLPVYLRAEEFGGDAAHLTVDAVFLEIGRKLIRQEKDGERLLPKNYESELDEWGQKVVRTFLGAENADVEAGAKGGWWLAYFRAQLKSRREWKEEKKQILEPKIHDLIDIVQRMAQEVKNRTGLQLLVVVDDLEKGDSEVHKDMHSRLFQESYDFLVQPNFSIVYTLPVYFRATPGRRIPGDQLYAFSAVRIYANGQKIRSKPPLDREGEGYRLMRDFVKGRVVNLSELCGEEEMDELLRIGGGLFRETARSIREAAYSALMRGGDRIEMEDVKRVFNSVKKEYQPMIRGKAIQILKEVDEAEQGWVDGVEPYLQSRAVVEYENGDLWLDLRYVLKNYVRGLAKAEAEGQSNRGSS
ncbi:MAG: hypothetical protein ACLFPR_13210 [Desulfococcaceae bacterium]